MATGTFDIGNPTTASIADRGDGTAIAAGEVARSVSLVDANQLVALASGCVVFLSSSDATKRREMSRILRPFARGS